MVIFLPFLLLSLVILPSSSTGADLREIAETTAALEAKNILSYGDQCNFSQEKQREKVGKDMIAGLSAMDSNRLQRSLNQLISLATSSGNFCNSLKNLQCQSSGKCGCAVTEVQGIRMTSIREGSACRLDRGSSCIPTESLASLGSRAPDLRCKDRTSCQLKSDRSVCTHNRMMQEIMGSFDMSRMRSNPRAFTSHVMNKMKEGLCHCA